jgi:hypothetical protein
MWRKSSYSPNGGNCVEVSWPGGVAVRDSKQTEGPTIGFPVRTWQAFLGNLPR